MEIRNLKTFLQVASIQNFTQAAAELGYSQSNVSAQIKQLEEEIGFPLFDRIGRSVHLTTYGEALLPFARQAVTSVLQIQNFKKSDLALDGTIRIGMSDSLFERMTDDTLLRYYQRFPHVQVELSLDPTSVLLEKISRGQLDAACLIGDPLSETQWTIQNAIEVPIVVVAGPGSPLSEKKRVKLRDLTDQPLILMEKSAPYSLLFEHALASQNIEVRPSIRLQSPEAARRLTERGPFLTVVPLYSVQRSIEKGLLKILDLPEWKETQQVQMVLHHAKVITSQIQGFLDILRDEWNSLLYNEKKDNGT